MVPNRLREEARLAVKCCRATSTGYRKLLLGQGTRWDAWLLDYPAGHGIPEHVNPLRATASTSEPRASDRGIASQRRRHVVSMGDRAVVFWSDRRHRVDPGTGRRVGALGRSLAARDREGGLMARAYKTLSLSLPPGVAKKLAAIGEHTGRVAARVAAES